MKKSNIARNIKNKINDWLKSIKDKELQEFVKDKIIVTGGSIVSLLQNIDVNDYDIYFTDPEAVIRIAQYYIKILQENGIDKNKSTDSNIPIYIVNGYGKQIESIDDYKKYLIDNNEKSKRIKVVIKSSGITTYEEIKDYQYFESLSIEASTEFVSKLIMDKQERDKEGLKYQPIYMSSNAITLSDDIQIILRFFGSPEEIHKNFDYVHCTNYWTSKDNIVVLNQEALETILNKELKYNGSKYPICSIFRLRKFIKKGWTINVGQILKICFQINDLDLNDIEVLEDQLIGVDAAYFHEVIQILREHLKETNSKEIDFTYLVQILDRVFE